jgi:hypothetical protein
MRRRAGPGRLLGPYPYRMDLASVLGADATAAITQAGSISFHLIGDTGGVAHPAPQKIVAAKLDADLADPAFLYLAGDCIYYSGELTQYSDQFYEPYVHYPSPIFAVPGNHDGDPLPGATTLDGFLATSARPPRRGPPRARPPADAFTLDLATHRVTTTAVPPPAPA